MISLFGEVSLIIALIFSFTQSVIPLIGHYRNNAYAKACARPSAWGQFVFVLIAYAFLTFAFATNDFSIAYVAENSHPLLPLMYRLTAVWGAHEGSILLWIVLLSTWTVIFASLEKKYPIQFLVLALLGVISFSFLSFLLFTSNPFLLATQPIAAQDLNPLLQDPGFVIHPPMLYTGYVGFSVAFAITQAALLQGNLNQAWAEMTRRYAMAAWCFLTLGIALGSWWAYRVLGWGGFWFWDPVENASLLPWMAGTALIHVLLLAEKRNVAKGWASFLAIICFALSLLGTFLVRSGILISAHTFANDPARGLFLLILLGILLTAALTIYVVRSPYLTKTTFLPFTRLSRETSLLLNSALLFIAMLTILLGTLYPLILEALHLGTISVGAPYFNTVMAPLVFITLAFMGGATLTRWQTQTFRNWWQHAWKPLLISVTSALAMLWFFVGQIDFAPAITLCLCFWVMLSAMKTYRLTPGMTLAHIGFAVLILGILLSSLLSQERDVRIKPGDEVTLGPYQFFYIDNTGVSGGNYRGIRAEFEVTKNSRHVINLYPEKRIYTVRNMVMTKVDIHPGLFRDLYIALGEPLEGEYWSVRLYYKPFVRWIWFGGMIMIIGGILTLLKRKQTT